MRMDAQTVGLLMFLVLIKNISTGYSAYFTVKPEKPKPKEGSCLEINCTVDQNRQEDDAYWFWMKDAEYNVTDYQGTVIYSSDTTQRPISPDFVNRVKYIGSPSLKYVTTKQKPLCGIFICNLKISDSGNYSFRYTADKFKWMTGAISLTVQKNECPLTFETPPAVNDSERITLTCSTSSSCASNPKIQSPETLSPEVSDQNKIFSVSFTASWKDDGKVFSCQTQDNTDKYLIRNISVTVEYAPKDIFTGTPKSVKEGDSVNVTCSARGSPRPTFSWFKGKEIKSTEAELIITSIHYLQGGEYHCEAQNKYGIIRSPPVNIDVTYEPHVEVKMVSPVSQLKKGDEMSLTCNVMRSNPAPSSYAWLKDGRPVGWQETYRKVIEPEDSGSYTCEATNSVGPGKSEPLEIKVQYKPRKTNISVAPGVSQSMKAGEPFKFSCNTDANPAPHTYSWYRFSKNKERNSLLWTSNTTTTKFLDLGLLQRADEAYYMCNATNDIDTGDDSEPMHVQVLYPPTEPTLSMEAEVMEGHRITVICTVESFPVSVLTLTRNNHPLEFPQNDIYLHSENTLHFDFNATSTDAGIYTCTAKNSEGSNKSQQRKLVVKSSPKGVMIKAQPNFVVNEGKSLILHCSAQSQSALTTFTWMKMIDGKDKTIQEESTLSFTIKSVSATDSGLYSCAASNEIGKGTSERVEVKVKYAPKHINTMISAEKQEGDGRSSVTLSCSTHCYPPVSSYSWKKKGEDKEEDKLVSNDQNFTVYSDQPGDYYCIAKNEINQGQSNPVPLFKGNLMRILKFVFLCVFIILIIFSVILVYRYRRKKTIQRRITSTQPAFGFLDWWNGTMRGNLMNEAVLAHPSRSRDDLLPNQTSRPNPQQRQPPPDSTPASNINSVYSTVTPAPRNQAPTAQKPTTQQGGDTEDSSLNYASLHFWNKPKNKQVKTENNTVYAEVSKPEPPKKNEERMADYENISAACAPRSSNPSDDDSDTSDDEVELNYSKVSFTAKPGHQTATSDSTSDSTSSDDDEIHYSDVKI